MLWRQVASFLDLGNGFALRELGHDAREETEEIHKLTESSAQDAAAVKLLTMIMLIYLPATVVSVRLVPGIHPWKR